VQLKERKKGEIKKEIKRRKMKSKRQETKG
jgi:hypothetical protein